LLQQFDMVDPVLIAGVDQAQRRSIADAFWKEGDPAVYALDELAPAQWLLRNRFV